MKRILPALAAVLLSAGFAHAQPAPGPSAPEADPFQWLEDIEAPRSMAWVEGQNLKSAAKLEGDARYKPMLAEARAIFTAQDRIPTPHFHAGGVENFWQDADHVHGLWRQTTIASYRTAQPQWTTLIDLDALSKAESRNFIWKGADCLKPAEAVCLVRLSNGGGDAVEIREFDTKTKSFVEKGFRFPDSRQTVTWVDADTLVAARIWKPGEATRSNYPYIAKLLGRDGSEREVFRGEPSDVSAGVLVLRGAGGKADALIGSRGVTFFKSTYSLLGDKGPALIPLPARVQYQDYVGGQMVFTIREDWQGFKAGSLIAYDLAALKKDVATAKPSLVFAPGPRQAIQNVTATDKTLTLVLLEDVKGAVEVLKPANGRWTASRIALPKDSAINVIDAAGADDRLFLTVEGFLEPTSLWLADAGSGKTEKLKQLPPRFDASTHVVEQLWATSTDGTKIPYFLVRPKAAKLDGNLPTLMFGYGGFELSYPPAYKPEMGKLWLERGGAFVIANIRGGGEFGPAWHEAAMREKRQIAFDDFASVARDLFARKITSPRHFGIYGRSNGGVLTTVSMTQHPELWNAIVIESPLTDMLRYQKLSVGASWIGEYGDPDIAADRAFIAKYSGYQNLKPGVAYPLVYITTNTRDDRVHPGHARKFAAKLESLGVPYLYYEQTFGGHANDADPELNARRWARHYVYLAQRLMD